MAKLYNLARMSTATTGTGTITLGSAVAGFLSFVSAGAVDGETVTYGIQDGSNSEIGRGVYTASGTTLTRSVLKSTNAGSAINLSGTAQVFITPCAEDFREVLTAARTYYVRTDGSDSNTGLANTAGGAFLTIQKAVDVVASIDLSIYNVTIKLATGTYSTTTGTVLKNCAGAGGVTIEGDTATPSNVVLTTSGVMTALTGTIYASGLTTIYTVTGVKFTSTATGTIWSIVAAFGSTVLVGANDFGSGYAAHIRAEHAGIIRVVASYTVSASVAVHITCNQGSGFRVNASSGFTVTLTGTPAFSSSFIQLTGVSWVSVTTGALAFSGSGTGIRYNVVANSALNTGGAGASYFPGDTAGVTGTGGQYL